MESAETYTVIQWDCPHCKFINVLDDFDDGEYSSVCVGCTKEVMMYVE